jgi:hypothetical protein
VIVAGPTSSRLLGSLETTVHTSGFKCFVRTFRPLFAFGHWETEIVECHYSTGIRFRNFTRFRHRHGIDLQRIQAVHDSFCQKINDLGRDGSDLGRAFSDAYHSLQEQDAVDGGGPTQALAKHPTTKSLAPRAYPHFRRTAPLTPE